MSNNQAQDHLLRRLSEAFQDVAKLGHEISAPVNLELVSSAVGVEFEWRRMIPEGTFQTSDDGVRIALQNDFLSLPGVLRRQRFTWAHELCHALLFDLSLRPPTPLPHAPTGEKLENLCNWGAARLLVPNTLLKRYVTRWNPITSTAQIDTLCETFDVSRQAIIRRLGEDGGELVGTGLAIVTTSIQDGAETILGACQNSWLAQHFGTPPKRGLKFGDWARSYLERARQTTEHSWTHPKSGVIMLRESSGFGCWQVVISQSSVT